MQIMLHGFINVQWQWPELMRLHLMMLSFISLVVGSSITIFHVLKYVAMATSMNLS